VEKRKNSKMQNSAKPPSELKLDGDNAAEWSFFVQKLNIYLQATKAEKETEEYKGAVLLNCVGDKALKIYNTFKFESVKEKTSFASIQAKFTAYFAPTINVTYERYIFFSRDMREEESVDEYVTQLKQLSENCEFGTLSESLIKDRLVLGIRDKNVKDRLLRTKNLDLVKAVEICKAAEITNKQMEILCTTSGRRTDEFQSVMGVRKTEDGQKRVQRQGTASGRDRDGKREEASSRQRGAHFKNPTDCAMLCLGIGDRERVQSLPVPSHYCLFIDSPLFTLSTILQYYDRDKTLQKYQLTNSTVSIDVLELLLKFDAKCKIFNPKYPSTHVI
jgi:hypothetical protein